MQLLFPQHWNDYQLIDSGGFEKLERFGKYIIRRPEPQAVWRKNMPEKEWEQQADAYFKKEKNKNALSDGNERGEWLLKKRMPEQWLVSYRYKAMELRFCLGLTSFKHVGIFPEQSENWNYIFDAVSELPVKTPRVLNLFAYTGGASLAAKAAGADVFHVDSVKQVLNWSRRNMEASSFENIHWVLEDVLKFVKREVRREKKYEGIVLDPPAYGRGPDGEKWVLEEQISELMGVCSSLLEAKNSFCVLNLYSMGFSSLIANNLIADYFSSPEKREYGELYLPDNAGRRLPLGVFCRFKR